MINKLSYIVLIMCIAVSSNSYADNNEKSKGDKAIKEHMKKDTKNKYKKEAGDKLGKDDIKDKEKEKSNSKQSNHDEKGLEKHREMKAE